MKKSIFLFFAAILCSVSAWAHNLAAGQYVYFEKPSDWEAAQLLIGKSSWSEGYTMTKISNTNLYYLQTIKWDGYTEYYFFEKKDKWGGEGNSPTNRIPWAGKTSSKYTSAIAKCHLFNSTKSIKSSTTATAYATVVNRTQTIKVQLKDGSNWVDATVVPADLTASTYALTSEKAAGAQSASLAKESTTVSATVSAAYSATVSLSCTNVLDGYMFEGWYDANGNKITSYTVSDAHTVYARFIQSAEETNEVSVTYMCDATEVSPAIAEIVGVETEKSFTAPTVIGYNFTGWTIGAGIDLKVGTASDATITVVTKSASSDYTLVANYEEVMETVYFINTRKWARVNIHKWDGNAANSSWPGEKLTASGEKIGEYDVYPYTAKQGDYANIIFNSKTSGTDSGNEQTADLVWTAGKYYIHNYNGTTGWKTYDEAVALLATAPDYFITGTKELVGGEGWQANEKKMTYDNSSKTWSYTFNALSTGVSYALKVTDGAWGDGHSDWGFSAIKNPVAGVVDDGGNVGFKLATAGDVTVTFDGANITVSTTGTFYVPKTYQYYIVGEMNSWSPNEDYGLSDDDTDGIYERELTWAAGTYIFKINVGDWGSQWGWSHVEGEYKEVQNANDDNKIKIVLDAEKTFTVKLDPTNNKISFAGLTRPGRYLTGNDAVFGYTDGNWTPNTIQMTWDDVNGIYTYTTPTLSANKNYVFRVTNGTWVGKWGYDKLDPVPDNVLSFGDDKNICFMLAAEGTITVTMNGDKLNLTTSSSFATPVYTIVGDEALAGHHWDLNASDNQMTLESENIYKLVKTITIPAGTYEYKAVRNHSYEWQVPAEGDNSINIEKSGTGTITYTLDISKPELTAAISDWVEQDLSTKVTLKGIGEDKDFTEAADGKTTSVSVTLEANQVYEFDIVVNSVYMKNNGTMWRENCTGWTFSQDANSAHIITDLAGTYTFTWTYEGNKLSVTYPTGTNVPKPVFLAGGMNNWDRLATRLIPSADGKTASVTIELNRNDAKEFRIVLGTDDLSNTGQMTRDNCTGWTFKQLTGDDASKNASILPDATGEYTFTWTYGDDKQLSVTYPEACTDCSGYYLVGSMNDWKQTADEFMKAEGTTVEISKELAAGSYEFKIKNGDDWYSDQDLTVTRSKSTSIAFDMKEGGNTHFTADIDGVYTFTYTTDQKKLTVTYPEIIIGDGDNSSVLNSLNGKTVDLKVTRSFASGTLYTLVLPFAMDNNTVKSIFGTNVELYDFTSLSENTSGELILSFTEQATPVIAAGTPYLIKPAANANGFELSDVTINTTTTTVEKKCGPTTITMQPVLSATAEDKTNGASQYWLAADNNLYNNVVSIKGLRVIFDVQTTKANVRARAAFNENVETGVEDLFTTDTPVKAIVNGQLIIIRDGVKYNVQGQKL